MKRTNNYSISIKAIITIVTVAMLTQACGGNVAKDTKQAEEIKITTKILAQSTVPVKNQFTGTVSSVKQSILSTRIMGQIDKVLVSEGDMVESGQLLLTIRSSDIKAKQKQVEATITQAQAAFKHAQDDFNRIQTLHKRNSATQKELDDITVHLEMTKAQLEAARKAKEEVSEMLNYANIRAPYAGVITQKFADSGDMANPGMPLLALEAPGLFEVNARIPESEINKVERGDKVEVSINACKEPVEGIISHISPSSRFSGSQFEASITLLPKSDQAKAIRSGVFAHVDHLKGSESKLLIDKTLLIERGQLHGVWVVSETNHALLRWVRTGKSYYNKIEVLSGLSEGNKLITSAEGRLFDGAKLQLNQ